MIRVNKMKKYCPHYHYCSMRISHEEGKLGHLWLETFCKSDFDKCLYLTVDMTKDITKVS